MIRSGFQSIHTLITALTARPQGRTVRVVQPGRCAVMTSEQHPNNLPLSPAVVILATPFARDLQYLRQLIEEKQMEPVAAGAYREVLAAIGRFGAMAVVCDESLQWRDLLSRLAEDCDPPRMIVVAAASSQGLWAEVLSLGGFDVLTKPFLKNEVERVLAQACSPSLQTTPPRRHPASEHPARPLPYLHTA